eukprot:gnl/TRDRNA2_/TRDRNA2_132687_c1_seq2.p1 gnl/TRDRNA2_/TRDRNA2_132687_c1~~gnl/TRDRNA2_/TRDRNA2_132687_c1_seq2.p1  ORF type:complete len:464 (+),score=75.46 gnl/TRDRNA2_/TRDRNA2_132687_c1_seq2:91-1482(+)
MTWFSRITSSFQKTSDSQSSGTDPIATYIAEFVGTFLLVFTVGCNVLTGSAVWAATSIASVLMVSIYAFGGISGAHFNPAVSLALGINKYTDWKTVGIYSCVQVLAAILAGIAYGLLLGEVFNLAPAKGSDHWAHAGTVEFLYTFMLCFVVLNVACSHAHHGNQFYGLAIGFVIVAGGYAGGHISGGCFNPAVAIGIDVSSAGLGFGWCGAYLLFELAGAAAAAGVYRFVRPEEFGGQEKTLVSRLLAEGLGTYFLVLTVGLNVIGGSPAPVWSIAAALMCMIFALGSVSGAHFNPAVTLAILLSGRGISSYKDAAMYCGVQISAGILAGFSYVALEDGESFPLAPGKKFGWGSAGVSEIAFTFLLCFVVLCVATVKDPLSEFFGLAIGSCVTAGGYAIGAVSGGSLNPAVSCGIALSHMSTDSWYCIPYTVFELIGATIAVAGFMATHGVEYQNKETALTVA